MTASHSGFSDATLRTWSSGESGSRKSQRELLCLLWNHLYLPDPNKEENSGSLNIWFSTCKRLLLHREQLCLLSSLWEPPVPTGSQQRGKLRIPEHLIKHLQKASFAQGALGVTGSPTVSTYALTVPARNTYAHQVFTESACVCLYGARMFPTWSSYARQGLSQKLKILKLLRPQAYNAIFIFPIHIYY